MGSKGQSAYEKMGTELRGMMDANANATQPKRCGDRGRLRTLYPALSDSQPKRCGDRGRRARP